MYNHMGVTDVDIKKDGLQMFVTQGGYSFKVIFTDVLNNYPNNSSVCLCNQPVIQKETSKPFLPGQTKIHQERWPEKRNHH